MPNTRGMAKQNDCDGDTVLLENSQEQDKDASVLSYVQNNTE